MRGVLMVERGGTAILASVVWHFGEVERARLLIEQAMRRARELGHPATIAHVLNWSAYLEIRRDDVAAARLAADASTKLAEEHGIDLYAIEGRLCAYWAGGRLVDPEVGASGLRQALQACMAKGNRNDAPFFHGMLAELEAATRGPDSALTLIDQGLTNRRRDGGRLMEPYLHRLRGDILLKRDPADPAPAEERQPDRHRHRQAAGARGLELLGVPLARQAPPIDRPPGATPTPSSRRRSKAFRRRRKCRKSPRRRRCSPGLPRPMRSRPRQRKEAPRISLEQAALGPHQNSPPSGEPKSTNFLDRRPMFMLCSNRRWMTARR